MNNEIQNKLKETQLEMLKVFIQICEKYKIKYFLIYGSCLGAVRHKGFIPWDDDIDVGLFRKEYEKFLEVAPKELPDNMFLQNIDSEPEYIANFAKLRNNDTTFIESSLAKLKINHGVYLDIFPIDGYIYDKKDSFKMKWYDLFILFNYDLKNLSFKKKLFRKICFLLKIDCKKYKYKREKLIKKYDCDRTNTVRSFCGAWGEKEIMPKWIFGNGTKAEFENLKVTIPEHYHDYLTILYGDYMVLPPVEKRVSHHYADVIDLDKSYTYYIN